MSARKRHTTRFDYLRWIAARGSVASHCEGGADVSLLLDLEKRGLVVRGRRAYGTGWGWPESKYSLSRTVWTVTEKGKALLERLDRNRHPRVRIHHRGRGAGSRMLTFRRRPDREGRDWLERDLNEVFGPQEGNIGRFPFILADE